MELYSCHVPLNLFEKKHKVILFRVNLSPPLTSHILVRGISYYSHLDNNIIAINTHTQKHNHNVRP